MVLPEPFPGARCARAYRYALLRVCAQLLSLTRRVDAAETNAVEALTALLVSADTPSQVRVHA